MALNDEEREKRLLMKEEAKELLEVIVANAKEEFADWDRGSALKGLKQIAEQEAVEEAHEKRLRSQQAEQREKENRGHSVETADAN